MTKNQNSRTLRTQKWYVLNFWTHQNWFHVKLSGKKSCHFHTVSKRSWKISSNQGILNLAPPSLFSDFTKIFTFVLILTIFLWTQIKYAKEGNSRSLSKDVLWKFLVGNWMNFSASKIYVNQFLIEIVIFPDSSQLKFTKIPEFDRKIDFT